MSHSAVLAASLIVAAVVVPLARGDLQKELRQTYTGKILSLRAPSNLDVLHFDGNGHPARPSEGEPWTTCGLFRVKKISANLGQIAIEGERQAVILSPESARKLLLVELDRPVHVTIDLPGTPQALAELNALLTRIFWPGDLITRMAAAWRAELDLSRTLSDISKIAPDGRVGVLAQDRPVYVSEALETPPMAIYKPVPALSEKARRKKSGGSFRVRMVVNEHGFPEIVEVLERLSEGFDSRALAAVSQWRFKPAQRKNLPVAAMLVVDVNLHAD
jgi:TonB family protein